MKPKENVLELQRRPWQYFSTDGHFFSVVPASILNRHLFTSILVSIPLTSLPHLFEGISYSMFCNPPFILYGSPWSLFKRVFASSCLSSPSTRATEDRKLLLRFHSSDKVRVANHSNTQASCSPAEIFKTVTKSGRRRSGSKISVAVILLFVVTRPSAQSSVSFFS